MLRLEGAHRVDVRDRDDGPQRSGHQRHAPADRAEADDQDRSAVDGEPGDVGEHGPHRQTDVVTVVEAILQRDVVPVEHREGELEVAEAVQPRRRRLQRPHRGPTPPRGRLDQLPTHVRERVGRLGQQPFQPLPALGLRHAAPAPYLHPSFREIRGRGVVGAVLVDRRDPDPGARPHQRLQGRGVVQQDVVEARHRAARKVDALDLGRDLRRHRHGDPPPFDVPRVDLIRECRVLDPGHRGRARAQAARGPAGAASDGAASK